jgi:hypothetical protein
MDNFQIALTPEGEPALQKAATVMRELAESYPGDRRWRTEPIDADLPSFALLAQHARREGAIGNALANLTRRAAQSAFAEQRIGALSPGQSADFLLIDRDIDTATPDEIAATRIVEHWIGGKLAWKSEAP